MSRTGRKANQSGSTLKGFSIYKDARGRNIYYDRLSHNGYVIAAGDVSQYNLYASRYIIPIIAFVLLYSVNIGGFEFGYIGAGAAAILALIAMEFAFRFRFLKSLTTIPNFQPSTQESYINRLKNSADKHVLFLKAGLYVLLGVLLIYYGIEQQFSLFEWIICGVISAVVIVTGAVNLIAAIKK